MRFFRPAVFSALTLTFSDVADAIVVGQRMGEVGLAAIAMTLPFYMVMNIFMHGFGIGGSVHYAKCYGEGKVQEAKDSFHLTMQCGLLISIALALVVNVFPQFCLGVLGTVPSDGILYESTASYLRIIAGGAPLFFGVYMLNYYLISDNQAQRANLGFTVGNVVDIGLNIVLVLMFHGGVEGAAISTLIGLSVTLAFYIPALTTKRQGLCLPKKLVPWNWRESKLRFRTGFSTSIQYIFQLLFLLLANHLLMDQLGMMGVAVFDMIQNVWFLLFYSYNASAKSLLPLASTLYGEKNMQGVKQTCKVALLAGLMLGGIAIAMIAVFAESVCGLFGLTDPATVVVGVSALRIFCTSASFAGISIILASYYQSVGQEHQAYVVELLRGGLVLWPCALLIGFLAPHYFWYVFPITEVLSLVVFFLWAHQTKPSTQPFDPEDVFSYTTDGQIDDVSAMTDAIETFCQSHHATTFQSYYAVMATEELSLAIVREGFPHHGKCMIQLTIIALPEGELEIHLRDNAKDFNPFTLETDLVNGEHVDMDAMGVLVIKSRANSFFYRRYQGFNSLIVRI